MPRRLREEPPIHEIRCAILASSMRKNKSTTWWMTRSMSAFDTNRSSPETRHHGADRIGDNERNLSLGANQSYMNGMNENILRDRLASVTFRIEVFPKRTFANGHSRTSSTTTRNTRTSARDDGLVVRRSSIPM